jgi:PAS domain S-box-containing protein
MHWLNGDGTVLWANQTELNVLGYTAEEYIGKPIMNFCPDEKELVLEIFKQLGSGNSIADVPVRFRTKDGRIVHLLIDSNVAYNLDGSFGHTRCFIRDDTARKIRDARVQLLIDENERVRDDTNAFFLPDIQPWSI